MGASYRHMRDMLRAHDQEAYSMGWTKNSPGLGRFPRTINERIRRMDRLMQWKVEQRGLRALRRLAWAFSIAVFPPALLLAASALWKLALHATLG